MKLKVTENSTVYHQGSTYQAGDTFDAPKAEADALLANGLAEEVKPKKTSSKKTSKK